MLQALLALIAASLFTGAAIYISVAEHPARLSLADAPALAQWQPSYRRAVPMQAGLALAAAALGLWAWLEAGDPRLLAGALLIFAVVPFTLFAIKPTNARMLAAAPEQAGPETRAMLVRWGGLHWVRNLLGLASIAAFALALAR
jgi:inner membrane protein involved in colicin E2 resistance